MEKEALIAIICLYLMIGSFVGHIIVGTRLWTFALMLSSLLALFWLPMSVGSEPLSWLGALLVTGTSFLGVVVFIFSSLLALVSIRD